MKSKTSLEGIEGHLMLIFHLKIHFFLDIFFVCNLILSKFGMNANMIKKTQIFYNMKLNSRVIECHFFNFMISTNFKKHLSEY